MATNNKAIVSDLPLILSQNIPTALVKYQREDFAAAYAIGNTPWLSAASDQNKITRITTTYQKERIDQGASAGENSLSNWWLRSATSWHHGAGERYYDADSSDLYKFYESYNIDPWTIGEIGLLKKTTNFSTSAVSSKPATVNGGTFYIQGGNVYFYNESTNTATSTSVNTSTAQVITSDGQSAIVGTTDGVYIVSTAMAVTKIWAKRSGVTTQTCQAMSYVKDRIILAVKEDSANVRVYELARNPASPPSTMSNTETRYTTTDTSVVYTSITDLNGSIIAAYKQGVYSRVQSYAIDTASPLAAIKEPNIIAELPRGEVINQIRSYLNEYVVMATNKGLRVGEQGTDGVSFTYGPLSIEDNIPDITFDSSYIYAIRNATTSGNKGLWRIDLGTRIGNVYAYASDLVTDGSDLIGVAFVGDSGRKFMTSNSGIWIESATVLAETGYLKSGWIRWGTAEKKQPISIAISSSNSGTLGFTVEDQEGNITTIGSIGIGMTNEIQLSAGLFPADHFEVTLNLTRDSVDNTKGPVVEEWQFRALPAPLRSRTLTVPLLCYEEERDPNGVTRISNPWERINYLERIEQSGGAVLYQDFTSGEERVCTIRAIQFEQSAPPTYANGFGGIVTIQLQTIDTEQAIK